MNDKILIGLRLESCRLSKGSYSFELDGIVDGKQYNFNVSTSCFLSFDENKIDILNGYSEGIWEFLETDLIDIIIDKEKEEAIFKFERGRKVYIWWDVPLRDNLIIVNSVNSKDWFTIL